MNRREPHVVLRSEPVSGRRSKNRNPRIASNARSPIGSISGTCPSRGQSQQARAAGDELTLGFLRHGRTKRMMEWKTKRPCLDITDRARRSFFPPSPGYPSLGCTPAEPNSVSPGNIHHTSSSECPFKSDKNGKPSCAKLDSQKRAHGAKTDRTRSPAPATARRSRAHDNAGNDGPSFGPSNSIAILSTEGRAHPFTCRY